MCAVLGYGRSPCYLMTDGDTPLLLQTLWHESWRHKPIGRHAYRPSHFPASDRRCSVHSMPALDNLSAGGSPVATRQDPWACWRASGMATQTISTNHSAAGLRIVSQGRALNSLRARWIACGVAQVAMAAASHSGGVRTDASGGGGSCGSGERRAL